MKDAAVAWAEVKMDATTMDRLKQEAASHRKGVEEYTPEERIAYARSIKKDIQKLVRYICIF